MKIKWGVPWELYKEAKKKRKELSEIPGVTQKRQEIRELETSALVTSAIIGGFVLVLVWALIT